MTATTRYPYKALPTYIHFAELTHSFPKHPADVDTARKYMV